MNVVVYGGTLNRAEMDMITEKAKSIKGCDHVSVTIDGDYLEIYYHIMPFSRLARITGYLTNDVTRWNDAKKAELKDRVKHNSIEDFNDEDNTRTLGAY